MKTGQKWIPKKEGENIMRCFVGWHISTEEQSTYITMFGCRLQPCTADTSTIRPICNVRTLHLGFALLRAGVRRAWFEWFNVGTQALRVCVCVCQTCASVPTHSGCINSVPLSVDV